MNNMYMSRFRKNFWKQFCAVKNQVSKTHRMPYKMQVNFRTRATDYKVLLRKLTYKDEASYESSPPCDTRQKSPVISGSFAENDLQLKASCAYLPPCNTSRQTKVRINMITLMITYVRYSEASLATKLRWSRRKIFVGKKTASKQFCAAKNEENEE